MVQPWAGKEGNFAAMKSGSLKYNGLEDRKLGEGAVRRDIGRCYAMPSQFYPIVRAAAGGEEGKHLADKFYALCQAGNIGGAEKLLRALHIHAEVIRFDDGARHQQARNGRGRVGRGASRAIVINPKAMLKYRAKIERRVGMAKGGFAGAADALGGMRGLPQWVTRHKGGGRADDFTGRADDPHAVLHNDVPWIDQVLNQSGAQLAVNITEGKMLTQIRYVVAHEARKAGFEVTPFGEEQPLLSF
jgi:hypothetical protein